MYEHMILGDIDNGDGVAALDPHGDLIERLLCLIPEEHLDRTVYFNPGDPNWVPLWNPLGRTPGQDDGRIADDLVGSIKNVVTGWGDRLESLLRFSILAMLSIPDATLRDVADLLRRNSEESNALRRRLYQVVENETVLKFWHHDFDGYRKDELTPPQHKLNKLLASGTVALMLSQSSSRINLRRIMDEGMILLVDLSNLGTEVREILGCFLLTLMHQTALSRSSTPPEKRRPFHIHCDEAHRFVTDALEDIIAETRKFNVSLTLAHQYLSQLGPRKADALANVGTTIAFNIDAKDARHLKKDLRDMVEVEDLIKLKRGQAIARIGTEIVRFETLPPKEIPKNHFRERIIAESRRRYYRPVAQVMDEIRGRGKRWCPPLRSASETPDEEFVYDHYCPGD